MEGEGDLRAPRRHHLEAEVRAGNQDAIQELFHGPQCPAAAVYLWGYYCDIALTRPTGGMGPSRVSRVEIRQWQDDEDVEFEPWERRAILDLDAAWLVSASPSTGSGGEASNEPSDEIVD